MGRKWIPTWQDSLTTMVLEQGYAAVLIAIGGVIRPVTADDVETATGLRDMLQDSLRRERIRQTLPRL
jgi:hypothetical protein